MHATAKILALAAAGLSLPTTTLASNSPSFPVRAVSSNQSEEWSPVEQIQGVNFFDHFNFYSGYDPTGGLTAYQGRKNATADNLAYIDDGGNAIVKADALTKLKSGQKRKSVRLQSKNAYDEGLTVITVNAMPWGNCSGVWPAWWSFDETDHAWPKGGEIDIIEGIESNKHNAMTLHTDKGCKMAANSSTNAFSGKQGGTNCYAYGGTGCGASDSGKNSYGKALNDAGGGVWATQFVSSGPMAGVTIWRFPMDQVPDDLTEGKPQPSTWGTPSSRWASSACDYKKYIGPQTMILNIALGGDWNAWSTGQCKTGSLNKAIQDPTNYVHAVWNISSIVVYQQT